LERLKLTIVVGVLALCAGPLASTSLAASSRSTRGTTTIATVQAEQMTLPAGASIISSSSASGGQAVELTQPGSALTSSVTLPSAATSVQVVAEGTKCQRGWPAVTASVDGATVLNGASVSSSSWTSYSATVSLAAGTHTLSISDSATNSCRTLYVDEVTFSGPAAPATPAPTVSLTASPLSITSGSASTLTWSATNATSCAASGGWSGSKSTAGSASTGALTASTQYSLSCTGPGGSSSASTTVTVTAATPAPTVSLTASPLSITAGSASTLTWSATNATSCAASGGWSGTKSTAGSASTGALAASTQYTLGCTGPGGSSSASTTVTVTPAAAKVCQSVAVPAYFYPSGGGGLWSSALSAEPGVGIMVANVDNGPGTALDTDYSSAISNARAAGVQVFGYVYTGYASRSLASVEADISTWKTLYGVTSIFLDEAATGSSSLSYYEALTNYVHQEGLGSLTIVNFGTTPSQSDMSAGDILITFEGDYVTYLGTQFPSWVNSYSPSRFYNIVYDVPDQPSMMNVMTDAANNHVGYIYATNDNLPNPYDTLPSYLDGEASQAHSGC
jgi:Spherulation-specific family 4/Carbohydrate binding module (family 6)